MQIIFAVVSVLSLALLVLHYRKRFIRIEKLIKDAEKAKSWKEIDEEIRKTKEKNKKTNNPLIILPGFIIAYTACLNDIQEKSVPFGVIIGLWIVGILCFERLMELYEDVSLEKANFLCNEKYSQENKEIMEFEDYVNGKI